MYNKRGQFYIIAAVVIIIAVLGIVGVTNYAKTKTDQVQTYQISKELNLESESVVNYGIFNKKDLSTVLSTFATNYSQYIGQQSDIYFLYGDQQIVKVIGYTSQSQGTIGIDFGGSQTVLTIQGRQLTSQDINVTGQQYVNVVIENKTYQFQLNQGQNFFFVLQGSRNA